MIRRAEIKDIPSIIELLHQVNMVHHVLRPDLFKPNTTKYDEQELEAMLENDSKPIFVFDNNGVYSGSFAMPGQASTLIINTGEGEDDDYDPNA